MKLRKMEDFGTFSFTSLNYYDISEGFWELKFLIIQNGTIQRSLPTTKRAIGKWALCEDEQIEGHCDQNRRWSSLSKRLASENGKNGNRSGSKSKFNKKSGSSFLLEIYRQNFVPAISSEMRWSQQRFLFFVCVGRGQRRRRLETVSLEISLNSIWGPFSV